MRKLICLLTLLCLCASMFAGCKGPSEGNAALKPVETQNYQSSPVETFIETEKDEKSRFQITAEGLVAKADSVLAKSNYSKLSECKMTTGKDTGSDKITYVYRSFDLGESISLVLYNDENNENLTEVFFIISDTSKLTNDSIKMYGMCAGIVLGIFFPDMDYNALRDKLGLTNFTKDNTSISNGDLANAIYIVKGETVMLMLTPRN